MLSGLNEITCKVPSLVPGTYSMPRKCHDSHVLLLNSIYIAETNGVYHFINPDFFLLLFPFPQYLSRKATLNIYIYFFFLFFLIFSLHITACRILVAQPGIESMPLAVEVQSLNHWTTKEVPSYVYFKSVI